MLGTLLDGLAPCGHLRFGLLDLVGEAFQVADKHRHIGCLGFKVALQAFERVRDRLRIKVKVLQLGKVLQVLVGNGVKRG